MRTPRRIAVSVTALLTASALLGPPAAAAEVFPVPADGVFRITGSGWGHGRGLSQWGAYQAATEGVGFRRILAFYYPGTALTEQRSGRVRVLLGSDTGRDLVVRARPGLAASVGSSGARRLASRPGTCARKATLWRVRATTSGLRLSARCGSWRTVRTTKAGTIAFSSSQGLVATVNGSARRGYRGAVSATRTGARSVRVVNAVPLEQYLRTVVAAEASPSWPREALRAQAVAARTYAATEMAQGSRSGFDVYDSTRSQVYLAAIAYTRSWRVASRREHDSTDAAIRDTSGLMVTVQGDPVLTQFSSSNGGATAASPLPHMVAAADPWDARSTRNPRRAWTDSVSARALQARYPSVGRVTAIEVRSRQGFGPAGGRVDELRIVGTTGSRVVSGDTAIRAALGTNSSMLTFTKPR